MLPRKPSVRVAHDSGLGARLDTVELFERLFKKTPFDAPADKRLRDSGFRLSSHNGRHGLSGGRFRGALRRVVRLDDAGHSWDGVDSRRGGLWI